MKRSEARQLRASIKERQETRREERERRQNKVDWDKIQKLAFIQCTFREICKTLNYNENLVQKLCNIKWGCNIIKKMEEWSEGGKASLRRTQWKLAKENVTMAIFLGKQYLGQKSDDKLALPTNFTQNIIHYGDSEAKTWDEMKHEEAEVLDVEVEKVKMDDKTRAYFDARHAARREQKLLELNDGRDTDSTV